MSPDTGTHTGDTGTDGVKAFTISFLNLLKMFAIKLDFKWIHLIYVILMETNLLYYFKKSLEESIYILHLAIYGKIFINIYLS